MTQPKTNNSRVIALAVLSSSMTIIALTVMPIMINQYVRPRLPVSQFYNSFFLRNSGVNTYQSSLPKLGRTMCDYPIVYNKPPKTASSYIQMTIMNWTKETGRSNFMCSQRPTRTNIVLQECIPIHGDACGVLNCHVFLDLYARQLLHERLPNHRLLTSTRYPAHRIVSFYMQMNGKKIDQPDDGVDLKNHTETILDGIREYLKTYNPWRLYNYHTGEDRVGSCPLTQAEKVKIFSMAARYNIVIDANLREASNIILKDHGLFTLPEVKGDRNKDRGAYKLQLPPDIKEQLRSKVCVEKILHRALQMRMASLYEKATGKQCLFEKDTCIEQMERKQLKSNWIF